MWGVYGVCGWCMVYVGGGGVCGGGGCMVYVGVGGVWCMWGVYGVCGGWGVYGVCGGWVVYGVCGGCMVYVGGGGWGVYVGSGWSISELPNGGFNFDLMFVFLITGLDLTDFGYCVKLS